MKSYDSITATYRAQNGLIRCIIINQLGELIPWWTTKKSAEAAVARGRNVRLPRDL